MLSWLSLLFICRENLRRSGILLFPDCPRFCRSSGMDGDKSGETGAFLFSLSVPDFCDVRRSFPINQNSKFVLRGRRRWISLITNRLNCWAPVSLSQIKMASLENTSDSYLESLAQEAKKNYMAFMAIIILGDPGAVTRAGIKGARKVFKHGQKSSWVPTLTVPFPNGQENAGS